MNLSFYKRDLRIVAGSCPSTMPESEDSNLIQDEIKINLKRDLVKCELCSLRRIIMVTKSTCWNTHRHHYIELYCITITSNYIEIVENYWEQRERLENTEINVRNREDLPQQRWTRSTDALDRSRNWSIGLPIKRWWNLIPLLARITLLALSGWLFNLKFYFYLNARAYSRLSVTSFKYVKHARIVLIDF